MAQNPTYVAYLGSRYLPGSQPMTRHLLWILYIDRERGDSDYKLTYQSQRARYGRIVYTVGAIVGCAAINFTNC